MSSEYETSVGVRWTTTHVQNLLPHLSEAIAESALWDLHEELTEEVEAFGDALLAKILRREGYSEKPSQISAKIKWNTGEVEDVTFGCEPAWFDINKNDHEDLTGDDEVFYWLTAKEYEKVCVWDPSHNFTLTDDWSLVDVDN